MRSLIEMPSLIHVSLAASANDVWVPHPWIHMNCTGPTSAVAFISRLWGRAAQLQEDVQSRLFMRVGAHLRRGSLGQPIVSNITKHPLLIKHCINVRMGRAPAHIHSSSLFSSRCRSFVSSPTFAASGFNGPHPQLAVPRGNRFQADCASSTWVCKNDMEKVIV